MAFIPHSGKATVVPFSSCPQSLPASESSSESTLHMRWPKYWSFSFSIIPSKEYPGLISFRMDWLDLLAVQGTLKSLLQHHRKNLLKFSLLIEYQSWQHALRLSSQFIFSFNNDIYWVLFTEDAEMKDGPCLQGAHSLILASIHNYWKKHSLD